MRFSFKGNIATLYSLTTDYREYLGAFKKPLYKAFKGLIRPFAAVWAPSMGQKKRQPSAGSSRKFCRRASEGMCLENHVVAKQQVLQTS